MNHRLGPLLAAATALVAACASTHQVSPPVDLQPRTVTETERYTVRHRGEVLGTLIALQIDDRDGPVRCWRVENRGGAWLGFVSEQGRFRRRLPFRDDEQDLGIWPMAQGVARLFDLDGRVDLQPLPVAVPASAPRGEAVAR